MVVDNTHSKRSVTHHLDFLTSKFGYSFYTVYGDHGGPPFCTGIEFDTQELSSFSTGIEFDSQEMNSVARELNFKSVS